MPPHLRAMLSVLDLAGRKRNCALWALWLTQWQGVLRCVELFLRKKSGRGAWDPATETHRARIAVVIDRDVHEAALSSHTSLTMKHLKNDPLRKRGLVKTFVVDERRLAFRR